MAYEFKVTINTENAAFMNFTENMIIMLRAGYAKVNTVDPEGESYRKLIKLLDSMPQATLKQIAGAKIKFVSPLASNRVKS